ncbi:hypothetical protein C0J52_23808 [Blattella germanica]|nr:hypothetical protein C0J52_23808 [Blattella germanica]
MKPRKSASRSRGRNDGSSRTNDRSSTRSGAGSTSGIFSVIRTTYYQLVDIRMLGRDQTIVSKTRRRFEDHQMVAIQKQEFKLKT